MKKRIIIVVSIFILILLGVYFGYYFYLKNEYDNGITVLAYHRFVTEEEKQEHYANDKYIMAVENLEEQLKYLHDNNYNSITPDQIECYLKKACHIPKKSFLITIDDGNDSSYYEALPLLEKYNIYGIVFVISGKAQAEEDNSATLKDLKYLDWEKLEDIKENHPYLIIASHTHNLHLYKNGKCAAYNSLHKDILEDVKLSKEELYDTPYFAYPYGRSTNSYLNALKEAGYKLAFKYNLRRKITVKDNPYMLPRYEVKDSDTLEDFKKIMNDSLSLKKYNKLLWKKFFN